MRYTSEAPRTLYAERIEMHPDRPLIYVCTASACRACGSRRVLFHTGQHRTEGHRVVGSASCPNCCIPWLGETIVILQGPIE